jgi:hypothetical protein
VQRQGRTAYLLFGRFEALGPLLDLLQPALRVKRCTSVSIDYLGARRTVDLLLSRSFEFRHSDRTIIVAPGNSIASEASGLAGMLTSPDRISTRLPAAGR